MAQDLDDKRKNDKRKTEFEGRWNQTYGKRPTDPKGITRIGNLITPPIETTPLEIKPTRGPRLIRCLTGAAPERVLVHKRVCVVARGRGVGLVCVGVEFVVFGDGGGLAGEEPADHGLGVLEA